MRILLVGPRYARTAGFDGPTSAFQSLVSGFRQARIPVTVFPQTPQSKIILYARLVLLLLRKWDIINVHLSANFGFIVRLFRLWSRSLVLTVHGYSRLEQSGNIYNKLMHALQVKWMFRQRVYVSHHIRQKVEHLEHLQGGMVIRNAVDVARIQQEASSIEQARVVDVFSLCGFSNTKGVHVLLQALEGNTTIQSCAIAGHHRDMFTNAMLSRGVRDRVSLMGSLTLGEVVHMLRKSKVYVQPSLYESFGIPAIEALALGVPVVVSKGAGVAEFLSHEVDCLLVEPGDAYGLGDAITRLLEDKSLYERIARTGRESAMQFLPQSVAKEYFALFNKVTGADT